MAYDKDNQRTAVFDATYDGKSQMFNRTIYDFQKVNNQKIKPQTVD